jgi:hypothetical protein
MPLYGCWQLQVLPCPRSGQHDWSCCPVRCLTWLLIVYHIALSWCHKSEYQIIYKQMLSK